MEKIIEESFSLIKNSDCDGVSVAIIDFKTGKVDLFENYKNKIVDNPFIYYDLASLSKPLCNSFSYISNKIQDDNLLLLLNHRAGIPAWGLLSSKTWKEQILSYKVNPSSELYSDFSALRYMLEFEDKTKLKLKDVLCENIDQNIKFWTDLDGTEFCLQNGFYKQKPNIGCVHDPNAYNLKVFVNHAGLFSKIDSLANSLIQFNEKFDFISLVASKMREEKNKNRFVYGFDTVRDPQNTLAGNGCSEFTFGHLGFTGTSFWIDAERNIGHVILTNSTKKYWYSKHYLTMFRKIVGNLTWQTTSR